MAQVRRQAGRDKGPAVNRHPDFPPRTGADPLRRVGPLKFEGYAPIALSAISPRPFRGLTVLSAGPDCGLARSLRRAEQHQSEERLGDQRVHLRIAQ